MQPSITRALPMGVIGFALGAALMILLRGLQGLEPLWDTGLGMIMGTFFAAGFFMWGIGAFNPRWSQHEHVEEEYEPAPGTALAAAQSAELAEAEEKEEEVVIEEDLSPVAILANWTWWIIVVTLGGLLVIAAFAFTPNPVQLIQTLDANASVHAAGSVPIMLFGQEVMVNQLILLGLFFLWIIVSLVIAGAVFAFVFWFATNGIELNQARTPTTRDLTPPLPARWAGKAAGWTARQMKRLPAALGQR